MVVSRYNALYTSLGLVLVSIQCVVWSLHVYAAILSLGRLLPEELELFYDSWKNIVTMNKHAQTVAAYKSVEVIEYIVVI